MTEDDKKLVAKCGRAYAHDPHEFSRPGFDNFIRECSGRLLYEPPTANECTHSCPEHCPK